MMGFSSGKIGSFDFPRPHSKMNRMKDSVQNVAASNGSSDILWSVVDSEAVVLDTRSGHYFSLNPIATEIWNQLHEGGSVSQIVQTVAAKYGVGVAIVQRDVTELIEELRGARLWK